MSNDPVVPLTPEQEAEHRASVRKYGYFKRLGIDVDDLGNGLTGGNCDETLSSRIGRDAVKGGRFARTAAKVLNVFGRNHCANAQAGDVERAQEVIDAEIKSGDVSEA